MNLAGLNPYAPLIKLGILVVLCASLFVGGCVHGKRVQAERDGAKLAKASADLLAAGGALSSAARALEDIDAQTKANVDAAQKQLALGDAAAKRAATERVIQAGRIADLERQLADERAGCNEGRVRVCGVPLR